MSDNGNSEVRGSGVERRDASEDEKQLSLPGFKIIKWMFVEAGFIKFDHI